MCVFCVLCVVFMRNPWMFLMWWNWDESPFPSVKKTLYPKDLCLCLDPNNPWKKCRFESLEIWVKQLTTTVNMKETLGSHGGHAFRILIIQCCSALWHSVILARWMRRTVSPTKHRLCVSFSKTTFDICVDIFCCFCFVLLFVYCIHFKCWSLILLNMFLFL